MFAKISLDGAVSEGPNEGRAFIDGGEGGDTFTYTWTREHAGGVGVLARGTYGDPRRCELHAATPSRR